MRCEGTESCRSPGGAYGYTVARVDHENVGLGELFLRPSLRGVRQRAIVMAPAPDSRRERGDLLDKR